MSVTKLFSDDPTIVNRYLAGQLDDAERVVFEAELARNPAALAELEATARLKVGLELCKGSGVPCELGLEYHALRIVQLAGEITIHDRRIVGEQFCNGHECSLPWSSHDQQ